MSAVGQTNQRLLNARLLLDLAQQRQFSGRTGDACRLALLESVCLQLQASYVAHLGELALANGLELEGGRDLETLCARCRASGREATAFQQLVELESSGWLGSLLQLTGELFVASDPRPKQLIVSSRGDHRLPGSIDVETVAAWVQAMEELVEQSRDLSQEF